MGYQAFLKKCEYKNFLQSYEWGEFCRVGKKKEPFYFGVEDDNNNLIGTIMMIKTNLFKGYSYMYAPRGFVLDYNNKELLSFFTKELKKYFRKNKVINMIVDPFLSYQELDNDANIIENGKNNYELYQYFLSLGYRHHGFTKNFESREPRYSFIIPFSNKTFDEVYNGFNKSMRQNIRRAEDLGVEVVHGSEKDLDIFNMLMKNTSIRDNFIPYGDDYYKEFYKIMNGAKKAELFVAYIYPKKVLAGIERLKEINKSKPTSIAKLTAMQEKYEKETREKIPVNAHMVVIDDGHATALYAGNDSEFRDTYSNYLMYYTKIKYAYEKNCIDFDLFGVPGDPHSTYKNLAGIFDFKKQFGGYLVEYMGDFDLIAYPFLYWLIPKLKKVYRFFRRAK